MNKVVGVVPMLLVVALLVGMVGCAPAATPTPAGQATQPPAATPTAAQAAKPTAAPAAPVEKKPIVIGYVGNVNSPGTKPDIDVQKMAVDEINAAGGILGRPVNFVVEDGKGETALSVDAATRMVMEHKAILYSVEGRSEINFATIEASAKLWNEYPHIYVCDGAMSEPITDVAIDKGYEWVFRAWDPEAAHYCWINDTIKIWKDIIGAKKVAILWEDLAWTKLWREGDPKRNLPSWAELAEKSGLQVVYNKPLKARYGMYLPIFEECARAGAQVIYYVSSWYTDTEVFAKQWADSAAKDIPIMTYGGIGQAPGPFWQLTGGKGLGLLSVVGDYEYPFTSKTIPFLKNAKARGITNLQWQPHFSYATIYLLKAAIEKAGTADDVKAIMKAMEQVEIEFSLGTLKFETQRVKPFFHSRVMADPKDPFKAVPKVFTYVVGQYQQDGKWVPFYCPDWSLGYPDLNQPKNYKTPAELRKAAGS